MSDIWTFSPSSEVYLKRCLDVATPVDPNNKWIKRFKKTDNIPEESDDFIDENKKIDIIEIYDSDPKTIEHENSKILNCESNDEFIESIEMDPLEKFDIVLEYLKSPDTAVKLSKELSVNTIEKISNHILRSDIDKKHLDNFYINFIPSFIKRENCRFSLDLLLNSNKAHPETFNKMLNLILKDLEIQNTIICEFSLNLNDKEKLQLINKYIEIDLIPEQFHHNLFTICTLYRDCKKTINLQENMEIFLHQNSEYCSKEKNFGKLLLNFLQEQKNFGPFKQLTLIEKVIERNGTPFKKPCLNIFRDILDKEKNN